MSADECYFCLNPCDGSNKTGFCPAFYDGCDNEIDPLEIGKRRLLSKSELYWKFTALYNPGEYDDE